MFDIRYHIVSLVAVFLALALGILLGFSLEKQGLLKKQQERLVESIQKDIDSVRSKNSNLQKQLASQKKFETNILPFLTEDKLKDHVVA
ncbi:MAG: copper transporter, partial [Actinobacteria bacterium]